VGTGGTSLSSDSTTISVNVGSGSLKIFFKVFNSFGLFIRLAFNPNPSAI